MRNLIYFVFLVVLFNASCETLKKVTRKGSLDDVAPVQYAVTGDRNKDYVGQFKDAAILEMERGGVPASIILAQGVLESGAGQSDLAQQANNHFGVKCGGSWNGKTYYKQDDDKDQDGNIIESCFRKYKDVEESYFDHGEFLRDPKKTNRYGFLFKLDRTDYKSWARGLQSAGYATNPVYADKLIDLIERYQLYNYDRPGAGTLPPGAVPVPSTQPGGTGTTPPDRNPSTGTTTTPGQKPNPNLPPSGTGRIKRINDVKVVISREGESVDDIANAYRLKTNKVVDYNDRGYAPGIRLKPNTPIFIQPKNDKWRGRATDHYIHENQTMFEVSQLYGITLEKLRARNGINADQEPETGERIKLRGCRAKGDFIKIREAGKPNGSPIKTNTGTTTTPGKMTPNNDDILFEMGENDPKPSGSTTGTPTNTTTSGPGRPSTTNSPYPSTDPTPNNNSGWGSGTGGGTGGGGTGGGTGNYGGKTHTVVKGDTLYNVARKYSITVAKLKQLNGMTDDNIKIGQTLKVQWNF